VLLKNSPCPAVSLCCAYMNPQFAKAGPPAQNKQTPLQTLLTCPSNFSARVKSIQNEISSKSQAMNSKTTFLC